MSDQRADDSKDRLPDVGDSALAGLREDGAAAPTAVLAEGSAAPLGPGREPRHFAPPAAGTLAAHATTSYAHACEIAAIALADISEYNQAVGSLTQVLPAATASRGRDGMTEQMPFAAPAGEPSADAAPSRRRVPRAAVVLLAVLALALAGVAAFFALGGPAYVASMLAEVDEETVRSVLEDDEAFMRGFASNDYVEERPYALSDVRIEQVIKVGDDLVRVEAAAVLANEFFESDCTATLSFARASRADEYPDFDHVERDEGAAWIGYVAEASAETRALAGVSHDPEFPEGFDPSFDAESQTCAFTKEEPLDLWFGTRTVSTPYTYSFDGRAWTRAAGEAESSLAISPDALDGAYGSGEGDAVRMGAFKVVNFDAADNTFTIEYRASTSGLSPQTISGVISCTLEVSPAEEGRETYRQSDGYVYAFHGQGTSTGGEGTSQIEGYLGLDGQIVFEFSGDYTKPAFLFGDPSNEAMSISGIVMRQAG